MKMKLTVLSLSLAAICVCNSVFATSISAAVLQDHLQKVVDDYYNSHSKKEKFTAIAASVLLPEDKRIDANDIKTVVAGTMGYPPLNQLINSSNLFDIGSITKSYVALILLQLQAEGKVSLEDPLGKWLPQYPKWSKVSLRKLLNMTSGIPNYSDDTVFLKKLYSNPSYSWTDEELLVYAHPEKPIKQNKKNLFEYSNSNYILAGMVIAKITQDTFENQLQQRILNSQNNLRNTFYPAGPDEKKVKESIIKRQVHGYYYDEKTKKSVDTIDNNLSWAGAAGAIVSNTEDVIRWVQLLYHGLLIHPTHKERALAELETVVSMKTGKSITTVTAEDPAGFGLGVGYLYDKESKQRFWVYMGSTLGFRVMYFWKPCNDVTTVVALNSKGGEGDPGSKLGNDIMQANLNLYKTIMQLYPELRCDD